jgi:hypothetical protein
LGDGRELTLRFDFDALCAVEDLVGDGRIDEVLAEMAGPIDPPPAAGRSASPSLRTQFRLLYGATRFHHGELTPDDCKGLVSAHNSEILWPMLSALGRAMGKGEEIDAATGEGGEAEADANPRPSAPGIGESSSTAGAPPGSTRRASEAANPRHLLKSPEGAPQGPQ